MHLSFQFHSFCSPLVIKVLINYVDIDFVNADLFFICVNKKREGLNPQSYTNLIVAIVAVGLPLFIITFALFTKSEKSGGKPFREVMNLM